MTVSISIGNFTRQFENTVSVVVVLAQSLIIAYYILSPENNQL